MVNGITTNLCSGRAYQNNTIKTVRNTAWKTPIQCLIIHEKGNHIVPVKTPTVNGNDV
jgi:hypothetical protein